MLRELHIANLAVIADARVELDGGLNCFTGQTGAGKSLVIGALEILLGFKQPQDMLRKGAAEGRITGVFHLAHAGLRQQIAGLLDLPVADEPELMVVRRIHESGRTSASVNGNPVTGGMLKALGETLVDVHGQHDQQYLLKAGNQLAVVDEFGGCMGLREEFAELFGQRQKLSAEQTELAASRTLRKQQLELYEFQAKEIDDAQLAAGEFDELQARHKVLSNLEKIKQKATGAYGALYEEEGSVLERLRVITAVIMEVAEMDESLGALATQMKDVTVSVDDAAFTLRRYGDRLEMDPAELAEVGQRLNLLNRMADKYGNVGTIEEVLAYREEIGKTLEELRRQDVGFSTVGDTILKVGKQIKAVGEKLSAARKKAVTALVPKIQGQLADLGMKEAKFMVELVEVEGSSSGFEGVEFMIAPNPGQPARPLRKIASGGELSRVMLALKSILAQADRVSVLVFDEIDANIGGRMGLVIGEKLRALSKVQQVLCITHLPQIAAYADRHLTIRKVSQGGESYTSVTRMEGEERVRELAEMITGKTVTETGLAQARELLGMAEEKAGDKKVEKVMEKAAGKKKK